MRRNPKLNPQAGDRLAKIETTLVRRGRRKPLQVDRVVSRTVVSVTGPTPNDIVAYKPKRVTRMCRLSEWREWAKDADVCKD